MSMSIDKCSNMSNFLQQERKRLGMTAEEVREALDTSRATYTRWEAGNPIPSDKLCVLDSVGFDIHFVVTGKRNVELLHSDALKSAMNRVLEEFPDRLNDVELVTSLVESFYKLEVSKVYN